jgi:hypothetical protein
LILIAVVEYGEFPEMLRVADIVKSRLRREVTVFFAKRRYRDLARDTAAVLERGHRWMDWQGVEQRVPAPAAAEPEAEEPAGKPYARVGWLRALAGDARALLRDLRGFRRRYAEIASIVSAARPELLIVGQDLLGKELSFALIAAARQGVPTLIVPFAMFSSRELAEYALARAEHHVGARPLNALLATRYPRWALRHEGKTLVRLQGSRGLALEWAGLAGGNPWSPCSEPATAIACESRVAMRNFASMGVPPARLRIVGSPVFDRLAAELAKGAAGREQLMDRHGFDPRRPLLVCGWPANIFAWLGERHIAYADYRALAKAWANALAQMRDSHGIQVLLTAHPKTLESELEEARSRALAVQRGGTEETIAHCDMFVTLNGSSITAWAIACRKPAVLFDCYRTGYRDFDSAAGCVMTEDESSFRAELDRLCREPERRARLAAAQAAVAADWGELDGRSTERLAALCGELIGAAA